MITILYYFILFYSLFIDRAMRQRLDLEMESSFYCFTTMIGQVPYVKSGESYFLITPYDVLLADLSSRRAEHRPGRRPLFLGRQSWQDS
jgi:hypothetical protein